MGVAYNDIGPEVNYVVKRDAARTRLLQQPHEFEYKLRLLSLVVKARLPVSCECVHASNVFTLIPCCMLLHVETGPRGRVVIKFGELRPFPYCLALALSHRYSRPCS